MAKQTGNFKNEALSGEDKGKSDFYETFDSGAGPVVPDGMEGDFAHQDSKGLAGYCQNGPDLDSLHGAVPEVPSKKR